MGCCVCGSRRLRQSCSRADVPASLLLQLLDRTQEMGSVTFGHFPHLDQILHLAIIHLTYDEQAIPRALEAAGAPGAVGAGQILPLTVTC
jgi:hypothetical protein